MVAALGAAGGQLPPAVAADPDVLAALLEAAPVGFAYLDRDLRYVHVNESLARANGRAADEHVGRTVGEVAPQVARPPRVERRHLTGCVEAESP